MKNTIKHIIVAMALTLGLSYTATSQTTAQKIGKNPTNIAPSAVLDIESDNKGVLLPRVNLTSTTDATTIASPAEGLTIYNRATAGTAPNTVTPGYYYWNGSRWVKLAVETPPIAFAKTVYVNATSPNLVAATIFDEANPPLSNDNALKAKDDNLYVASDGSTWTYNTVESNYKTYAVAASTPFNLANTTTDAGYNKTASIWRSGNVGIGTTNPSRFLDVVNNSSTYNGIIEAEGPVSNFFTRAMAIRMRRGTSAAPTAIQLNDISAFGFVGYDGSAFSSSAAGVAGIATENWTSSNKGMALTFNTTVNGNNSITEKMRVDHNGNVGIGTIAPISQLSNAPTGTNFVSSNSAVQSATGISWLTNTTGFNTSLFNSNNVVGSNGLQVKIANTSNQTTAFEVGQNTSQTGVSNPLFNVLGNGNVGVGTNNPTSRLEVNGSATNRVSHDAVSSTTIDFSQSNLARTIVNLSSNPTFTLNGIKDGGTYTLRVTSSATGRASFSAPGLTSTTFSSPNDGVAAAGDTLYTFMVIGNKVFFYMTTGL